MTEPLSESFYSDARRTVAYAIEKGWASYPKEQNENIMPPRGKLKDDYKIEPFIRANWIIER